MILNKGRVLGEVATAHELRQRIAALKHVPLPDIVADEIAALEPLAAALEVWEAHEQAVGARLIRPTVEVWH